jgi:hypothetical protein
MNIFVVVAQPDANAARLPGAIAARFPDNHYQISDTTWIVAGSGTPNDIVEKLNLGSGGNGSAIVFSASGYWGWASNSIWTWLKAKWEAKPSG